MSQSNIFEFDLNTTHWNFYHLNLFLQPARVFYSKPTKSFQIAHQEKQKFLFHEFNINQTGSAYFYKFWATIAKQAFAGPSANIDVRIPYKLLKNPI